MQTEATIRLIRDLFQQWERLNQHQGFILQASDGWWEQAELVFDALYKEYPIRVPAISESWVGGVQQWKMVDQPGPLSVVLMGLSGRISLYFDLDEQRFVDHDQFVDQQQWSPMRAEKGTDPRFIPVKVLPHTVKFLRWMGEAGLREPKTTLAEARASVAEGLPGKIMGYKLPVFMLRDAQPDELKIMQDALENI
jgi:hypothetical protein